jgi:hypothetical protein
MSSSGKGCDRSLRLPIQEAKAVKEVCRESRATFNQVVSLCVRKALPSVREALTAETVRVTNVDPLPDKVLRRLYNQADDDADSIRLFMAAQAKTVEE